MNHSNLITLTDANFEAEVLRSAKPVLVDFWAPWCSPCRAIAPILDEIAHDHAAALAIGKLDIDTEPVVTETYGVLSIPTLILFVDGKPAERIVGFMPKERLVARLKPHLMAMAG